MAKDSPKPKTPKELTPFEKFDRLAKRVIRVPKERIREADKQRPSQRRSSSDSANA